MFVVLKYLVLATGQMAKHVSLMGWGAWWLARVVTAAWQRALQVFCVAVLDCCLIVTCGDGGRTREPGGGVAHAGYGAHRLCSCWWPGAGWSRPRSYGPGPRVRCVPGGGIRRCVRGPAWSRMPVCTGTLTWVCLDGPAEEGCVSSGPGVHCCRYSWNRSTYGCSVAGRSVLSIHSRPCSWRGS